MRVACGKCNATYEFDASAIPAEGYDAQCTHCGEVFFVAPDRNKSPVSVACSSCRTVYQFAASEIPAGGYDAQCSQCGAVFFVSTSGTASGAGPSSSAPVGAAAVAQVEGGAAAPGRAAEPPPPAVATRAAVGAGSTDAEAKAGPAPAAVPVEPAGESPPGSAGPATTVADANREPTASDAGDDLFALRRKRRRRRLLVAAAVTSVVAAAVPVFLALRAARDAAPDLRVAAPRLPPPQAGAALERARARLLADSPSAYEQALVELEGVRRLAPDLGDAAALAGLVRVFRGADQLAAGKRLQEQARRLRDELPAAPANKSAKATIRLEAGRREAVELERRAGDILAAGAKELAAALALLDTELVREPGSALAVLAVGFYHAADGAANPKAEEMLARSLELRVGPGAVLDPQAPPDPFTALLRADLWAQAPGQKRLAREAYVVALRLEPRMQRARYALAVEAADAGDLDQARRLLDEVLAAVPDHARARARRASLAAAVRPATAADEDGGAKAKKRKAKRGRR